MNDNICERINLTTMEKNFLIQLLSIFDENRDNMYYEVDSDPEAKEAFDNLCLACDYSNKPEMTEETTQKCLKILGS